MASSGFNGEYSTHLFPVSYDGALDSYPYITESRYIIDPSVNTPPHLGQLALTHDENGYAAPGTIVAVDVDSGTAAIEIDAATVFKRPASKRDAA